MAPILELTPPPEAATFPFKDTTTAVAGNGGYSNVGTIEGWIQIESKDKDPQRLLTLIGRTLEGKKDEYWIEFLAASGKLRFPKSEADAPFADGKLHHFAFTLDRDDGMSLAFDGKDPQKLALEEDKLKADLLIQQLTIGHFKDPSGKDHPGFVGKIAGLHLWKKPLTSTEIGAAGNWHTSYCPTIDFGFKGIADPIDLLGYLNPVVPSFIFYYEPRGHWVMESTENDEPKQEELRDCDQYRHAIYAASRYFLTTREKKSSKLHIISDQEDKKPLGLSPDQSQQFVFTADDLILKFNPQLTKVKAEKNFEAIRETFSIETKSGKALPDEFLPPPDGEPKSSFKRPKVLQEKKWNETLGSIFQHNPPNFDISRLGWNEVKMKNPFLSNSTGAQHFVFNWPPLDSKCYDRKSNLAIPYGFTYVPKPFATGTMHSTLIANGSDLRSAATHAKSITGSAKGGVAFVSASMSFHYNSELGHTEESMYDDEVMHSEHTYFVSTHVIVLDKANVHLGGEGSVEGFKPDIQLYAKGNKSGNAIFDAYGTHYANAICYGARGRARQTYTKEVMSTLLQDCKKIGWGVQAKVSGTIKAFKGGLGGGYSQDDANEDSKKITKTQSSDESEYTCIGGSGCTQYGDVHGVEANAIPVLLDLRPITELLAPPFFDTYDMTVNVRGRLESDLKKYLAGKKPREVDVFHYLSLSFLQPRAEVPGGRGFPARFIFRSHLPADVRVSGSPSGEKDRDLRFQLKPFVGEQQMLLKQAFCHSGSKTNHQIFIEFTLPNGTAEQPGWRFGSETAAATPVVDAAQVMKLNFALDDERLNSKEGLTETFVLSTKVWSVMFDKPRQTDLILKFPVVLKKLNLRDAFFNGLPAEWRENFKSLVHR